MLLAEKLSKNKLNKVYQSWNFGPNISNCKSVKYIADYFAKSLKLKIKIAKNNSKDFKGWSFELSLLFKISLLLEFLKFISNPTCENSLVISKSLKKR